MAKDEDILMRAELFRWWTPAVADIVENVGRDIAWFFRQPQRGVLEITAKFCGEIITAHLSMDQVEQAADLFIPFTMKKMLGQLRTWEGAKQLRNTP